MKKEEKALFFDLCKFQDVNPEELKRRLRAGCATSAVLGALFWNRTAGVAYGVLAENQALDLINREFRSSLKGAYQQNQQQNSSFYTCLTLLNQVLLPCRGKYAMLKGAVLCGAYPEGFRTSNDIDLLVRGEDVTAVGKALTAAGFKQGYVRNGRLVVASRQEIISSKMMRGETVPYILEVNLPLMPFLEVDLNFSLDYKNGDPSLVSGLIARSQRMRVHGTEITTLNRVDFVIHLCDHLYKEATTYPWVHMHRDMTLYKYLDLYFLLNGLTETSAADMSRRIDELGTQRACYYAVACSRTLFSIENPAVASLLTSIAPDDLSYMDIVFDPANHRQLRYAQHDIVKRFWHPDRCELLEVM